MNRFYIAKIKYKIGVLLYFNNRIIILSLINFFFYILF